MKKIILFSLAFILMGSYGGIIGFAHAQSLSPVTASQISQQLQAAKAELLSLQTQEQTGTSAITPAAPVALSTQDVASLQNALSALSATLLQVEQVAAAQHGALTAQQKTVVSVALGGISTDLSNIAVAISESAAQPVATAQTNTPSVAQVNAGVPQTAVNQPAATQNSVGLSVGASISPNTQTVPAATPGSQTAVISSHFPVTRDVEIVLGILLLVVIVALAWPRRKEEKSNSQSRRNAAPVVASVVPANTTSTVSTPLPTNSSSVNPGMKQVAQNVPQRPMSGSNQKPA